MAKYKTRRFSAGSIICFVLCGIMLVLFLSSLSDGESAAQSLDDAAYIGSAAPDAACEGRIVILTGSLTLDAPAADPETGVIISAPRIGRTVQKLVEHYDKDKDEYTYTWNAAGSAYFCGEASVNGTRLAEEMLNKLPISRVCSDYDPAALAAHGFAPYEDKSTAQYYYITDDAQIAAGNVRRTWEHVGAHRMYYTCSEFRGGDPVTVIGVLNGGTLGIPKDFVRPYVYAGALTREELQKALSDYNKETGKYMLIAAAIFFLIGDVLIFRRPKKSAQQ